MDNNTAGVILFGLFLICVTIGFVAYMKYKK